MNRLEDKVAIVTGASRGQGAAEARLFAELGARVVLTDISGDGAAIASEIGANALFVQQDVSLETDWAKVVAAALDRFGKIDILVNNAAIFESAPIQDSSAELVERMYRVNQFGLFLGMKAVIEPMRTAGGGSIVNVASEAGTKGRANSFAYAATKWAVRGMTRCAATDLAGFGIRVNCILPGLIDTPMISVNSPEVLTAIQAAIPAGRMGDPLEIARAAAFLASDAASYISGADLSVDGGIGAT